MLYGNMVNTVPSNGLLPDGTKPLLETMLTYNQWGPVELIWWQYSLEILKKISLKEVWKLQI